MCDGKPFSSHSKHVCKLCQDQQSWRRRKWGENCARMWLRNDWFGDFFPFLGNLGWKVGKAHGAGETSCHALSFLICSLQVRFLPLSSKEGENPMNLSSCHVVRYCVACKLCHCQWKLGFAKLLHRPKQNDILNVQIKLLMACLVQR